AYLPAFGCLEAVCWASLRHTCLRHMSQYAVFQDAFTIPTVVRHIFQYAVSSKQLTMFESTITEYLDKTKDKDWTILGILKKIKLFRKIKLSDGIAPKLSVATIDDFKKDLTQYYVAIKTNVTFTIYQKQGAKKYDIDLYSYGFK
ncbi:3766_t:CDS:2, partial [Ambispora leptoticha]